MNQNFKPITAVLALSLAALAVNAHGQQSVELPAVLVTATRFGEANPMAAANAITISREDIENSGARTLPDVLKTVSGLQVRPLYGSIGADTAVDMRGFGDGATQRTLVLLNGQRLNPLDGSSIDWGLVPLDSVERIEIMSGSASVLYGDNAVGGVINIITGKTRDGASIQAGLGSADGRQLSASLGKQLGGVNISLSANHQATGGWRDNNHQERNNAAGRIGMQLDRGEAFVDIGWSNLALGLPGVLTSAQYQRNPRQAETLDSAAERRAAFIRPGFGWQLTETLKFAAEVGYSEQDNLSWISNFPAYDRRKTSSVSFTPRLQWAHGLAGLSSSTTLGFDYYDGELTSDKSASRGGPITKTVAIDQLSQAFYLQNRTRLAPGLTLTVGARRQKVEQSARDSSGLRFGNNHERTIGDLGLNYAVAPGVNLFARTGSTFRYATLDELTTFTGFVSKPVRPEKGRFLDVGTQWSGNSHSLKATAYALNMTDEIAWNNATFENENLAKTRHQGIEVNGTYDLDRRWQLNGGINYQRAEFVEGTDQGKQIPLVPSFQATAGLSYKPSAAWRLSVLANHVGERYFGGDTGNQRAKLPEYTTADLVTSWRQSAWTARARILNLFDKKYAPAGYDYGFGASYYPADGRTFFADVRYDF